MVNKDAPEGQEFELVSGRKVHTIEGLLEYFRQISQEEFDHHVTDDRNDFANWIRDVHGRYDIAKAVELANNRSEAIVALRQAVKAFYETEEEQEKKSKKQKKAKEPREPAKPKKEKTASKEKKTGKKAEEHPVSTSHGEFMTKEFVYGLIFGFILGVIAIGIFNAL